MTSRVRRLLHFAEYSTCQGLGDVYRTRKSWLWCTVWALASITAYIVCVWQCYVRVQPPARPAHMPAYHCSNK